MAQCFTVSSLFAFLLVSLPAVVESRLRLNFPQTAGAAITQPGVLPFPNSKNEEPFKPGYYIEFSNPLWYLVSRTKDIFARSGRYEKKESETINWRRLINPMDMGSFPLMRHRIIKEKK